MLTEIPGVGALCEGLLERDPLDETYQVRFLDPLGRQQVVRLQDLFIKYCNREVRLTIAFADALRRTMDEVQIQRATEAAVTFEDLAKEPREP